MVRIEVLAREGEHDVLAGVFSTTDLSPAQAVSLPQSEFAKVTGEWCPSGGFSHLFALGRGWQESLVQSGSFNWRNCRD